MGKWSKRKAYGQVKKKPSQRVSDEKKSQWVRGKKKNHTSKCWKQMAYGQYGKIDKWRIHFDKKIEGYGTKLYKVL